MNMHEKVIARDRDHLLQLIEEAFEEEGKIKRCLVCVCMKISGCRLDLSLDNSRHLRSFRKHQRMGRIQCDGHEWHVFWRWSDPES